MACNKVHRSRVSEHNSGLVVPPAVLKMAELKIEQAELKIDETEGRGQ